MSELTLAGETTVDPSLAQADARGAERLERRLLIALSGGVLLTVSALAYAFDAHPQVAQIPAFIGAIVLVIPLAVGAWRELVRGKPSSDCLASLAVIAAIASSQYLAAGFLALFLWMANLILSRTAWGAQRAIRDLIDLTPDIARLVDETGTERDVPLTQVHVGQVVRVRPGENLPADGRVVRGTS